MSRPKIATYYSRLKVAPDAPPEVIRAAYKALAQKYHPDRHRGSIRHEIVLAALNKAQDVLLDPERRAAHDHWIRAEETRLGWRVPPAAEARSSLSCAERWQLMAESMRLDGLSFGAACRLHFTRAQRCMALLTAVLVTTLACMGAGALLRSQKSPLDRLVTTLPPMASPSLEAAAAAPDLRSTAFESRVPR
jgi:hypothetical protein